MSKKHKIRSAQIAAQIAPPPYPDQWTLAENRRVALQYVTSQWHSSDEAPWINAADVVSAAREFEDYLNGALS